MKTHLQAERFEGQKEKSKMAIYLPDTDVYIACRRACGSRHVVHRPTAAVAVISSKCRRVEIKQEEERLER